MDRVRMASGAAATPSPLRIQDVDRTKWSLFSVLLNAPPRDIPALRAFLQAGDGAGRLPAPLEALGRSVDVADFSCGVPLLDEALRKEWANGHLAADEPARGTFVVAIDGRVVAYYAQRGLLVRHLPAAGGAAMVIPVVRLARLAIDLRYQGTGLGSILLADALARAQRVGAPFGARALCLHALTDAARRFYLARGFRVMPDVLDPRGLMVRFADVARAAAEP